MSKPKTTPQPRVSRITMAKLYNTGNYEHVRYELTVEVPEGTSSRTALIDTARILAGIGPQKKPYGYEQAKQTLLKPYTEITLIEAEKIEEARKIVADWDQRVTYRDECLRRLDDLGGTRKHTDAKDSWGDNNDCPF